MFALTRAVASPVLRRAVTSVAFQRFAVAAAVNVLAPKLIHATRVAHMASATKPTEEFVRLPVSVTFQYVICRVVMCEGEQSALTRACFGCMATAARTTRRSCACC